jgi:hypothetical protein
MVKPVHIQINTAGGAFREGSDSTRVWFREFP